MNPARSFAPALVAGYWDDHWVYWVGPTMGALLGLILWQLFVKPPESEPEAPHLVRVDNMDTMSIDNNNNNHMSMQDFSK